jgi:NTE family protein
MPSSGPKNALVLSAGGMFGAYQAGAWKALAGRFRPDIVIGASVGALNGWAIAGGAAPEQLIEQWLDPGCAHLARIRRPGAPWRGIFDPAPLEARAEALWKAYRPRVQVGVVAVELGRFRPRLFRNEEITWRHLAASCAVLMCYPQVRIESRLFTDGGLLGALPLWAAATLGAERIVAINVLDRAPSRLLRAAVSVVRAALPRPPCLGPLAGLCLIAPSRPLGSLREAVFWDEAAVRRSIELGEADAGRAVVECF